MRIAPLGWPECRRMSPRAKAPELEMCPMKKRGAVAGCPARPHGIARPLASGDVVCNRLLGRNRGRGAFDHFPMSRAPTIDVQVRGLPDESAVTTAPEFR